MTGFVQPVVRMHAFPESMRAGREQALGVCTCMQLQYQHQEHRIWNNCKDSSSRDRYKTLLSYVYLVRGRNPNVDPDPNLVKNIYM